jgi:plastocyanin
VARPSDIRTGIERTRRARAARIRSTGIVRLTLRTLIVCAIAGAVTPASGAGGFEISQKNKQFSVATLTIKPGDKVMFKNDDDIIHNVFSTSKGSEFNTSAQKPGSVFEQTFSSEGVVDVRCAFHPRMTLTITVKK